MPVEGGARIVTPTISVWSVYISRLWLGESLKVTPLTMTLVLSFRYIRRGRKSLRFCHHTRPCPSTVPPPVNAMLSRLEPVITSTLPGHLLRSLLTSTVAPAATLTCVLLDLIWKANVRYVAPSVLLMLLPPPLLAGNTTVPPLPLAAASNAAWMADVSSVFPSPLAP